MHNPHRPTRTLSAIALGAATILGIQACSPLRHGGTGANAPAIVYFTNESADQADVYAVVSGSQPVRIGTVFSNRTDTLRVPGDIAARGSNVSVVARLLARNNVPSTGPLAIHPGDKLSVRLPADQRQLVVLPGDR
jgi:hypothetical protein